MKKIKFRGKNIKTGKFVYGGIIQDEKQSIIVNIYLDDEGYPCPDYVDVVPESVAQLVGYDADGKEIYEGDVCVDKYYCTYGEKAGLMATFNNFISGDEDQHFSYYKLKGNENENN